MPTWLEITFILITLIAPIVFIRALSRAGRRAADADFAPDAPAAPPGDAQ